MRALLGALTAALAGCQSAPSLEQARLASASPEIASCAEWYRALDREVAAAGVRDLEYSAVPGFPYLRADPFLAQSRARAARRPVAFAAFADRLLQHDLESRRYEIDNLPAAVVEKWSGMRLDDSRAAALRRSAQCGRRLREVELAQPQMRSAVLGGATIAPSPPGGNACPEVAAGAGAIVRYAPPSSRLSRLEVAGWLLRREVDPLGQPLLSQAQLADLAPAYAPSLQVVVASDADRFGALRWRRGVVRPEIDATEPAVYVGLDYARYEEQALLQIVYTVLFAENRITWRVTLAPDGEPLFYDAAGPDGCRAVVLTPRAQLRAAAARPSRRLMRVAENARPLLVVAAGTHGIAGVGVVRGSDSLARYTLRPYGELRSAPALEGRNRAAGGRPALRDGEPLEARLVLDLAEPRP